MSIPEVGPNHLPPVRREYIQSIELSNITIQANSRREIKTNFKEDLPPKYEEIFPNINNSHRF